MARTDAHRPSAIIPEDYFFIAAFGKGDCLMGATENARQRSILQEHMKRTGGDYSKHEHGGSCHVCGASFIYSAVFYHQPSNTYIRTGFDCAEKMEVSESEYNLFRKVRTEAQALQRAKAGKLKARALLDEQGLLSKVETLFENGDVGGVMSDALWAWCDKAIEKYDDAGDNYLKQVAIRFEDNMCTAADIVRKLVRYGDLSEKQWKFLDSLVQRCSFEAVQKHIDNIMAKREEERANASPAPTGRVEVVGEIVSTKWKESQFGCVRKMLVKADDGYKVWASVPSTIDGDDLEKGTKVQFTATLTPSDNDETFAFGSRPAKAKIL